MKKKMLALGAMASLALSAQAQVYNWSLTTSDGFEPGNGSGQLTLTSGLITAMSGTIGGLSLSLLAPNSHWNNDNQLPLTGLGFAIQLSNSSKWSIGSSYGGSWFGSGHQGSATFSYTPVPEPGTWAMGCVFGLAAVVTVAARRRQQVAKA